MMRSEDAMTINEQILKKAAEAVKGMCTYGKPAIITDDIKKMVAQLGGLKRVRYTPPPHMSRGKYIDKRAFRRYMRKYARLERFIETEQKENP